MIVTPLALHGVFRLELQLHGDNRGFFARSFCRDELRAAGVPFEIAQCNISHNRAALTLRGMHYARAPASEGKIVRCTAGCVWDVLADLRPNSPTYLKWGAQELSADNRFSLLVPPGVAHGFLSLRPDSEVLYLMSEAYRPDCAAGVRWDDPALGIRWPDRPAVMSDRDRELPSGTGPAVADPRNFFAALDALDRPAAGADMHALVRRLFPVCRSLTGPGNRETLAVLRETLPLDVTEVPSGSPVLDWTVPPEWSVREAWIRDPAGRVVVDFRNHNLHLVGYSAPVRRKLPLAELQKHLHSLPAQPDLIPYRTSYYNETWGFCLPHALREALPEGEYEVCVDTTLAPGSLSIGEIVLPGATTDEVLISTHICHPSLANDNLSGIAVALRLAAILSALPRRHTFRFVFLPGTIGSITWLARNRDASSRVHHGLVLSCVGDPAAPAYKKSRRGDAAIDRAMAHVLHHRAQGARVLEFSPYGYDERQYGSPGFNLPVGLFMRSVFGTFPEYHTSADNPDLITPGALSDSLALVLEALAVIEGNGVYLNTSPHGEPMLGRRGLYEAMGGGNDRQTRQLALLWVLNQSDGTNSLLDIAVRSGLPFRLIREAADLLLKTDLLIPSP